MARATETSRTCVNVPSCPLAPVFMGRPSLRVWRERYCDGRFETCARYALTRRGEDVPPWLLPNGRSLLAPAA